MDKGVVKVDLHTHSSASKDGGITLSGYKNALHSGLLSYIAITDHNEISAAVKAKNMLGDRIIVGEEIMTTDGEVIGLYLKHKIEPGMSLLETIKHIKLQHGLVYIPHPFETVRSGVSHSSLALVTDMIDIIEIRNGRALLQNKSKQAVDWSHANTVTGAASSDAHSYSGLGRTYSLLGARPSQDTLVALLAEASHSTKLAKLPSLFSPKINRIKRQIRVA